MKTFVINLDGASTRWDAMVTQLTPLNIDYERVPGVLGRALSQQDLAQHYDKRRARRRLCMDLVPAHIGCSLSHIRVYEEIVARRLGVALILEDDVLIPASLPSVLSSLGSVINQDKPEVVLLSPTLSVSHSPRLARELAGGGTLRPFRRGYYASSYIVTGVAASALIKELYPIDDVADCWERLRRYGVVQVLALDPPLIVQDQIAHGSSTTSDTEASLRLLERRRGWRLSYRLCRIRHKLLDGVYGLYRRYLCS